MKELNYANLKFIKRINDESEGEMTWADLIKIFGKAIWLWNFDDEEDSDKKNEDLNLEYNELRLIIKALKKESWVQNRACKLLGITSRKLNYKIDKYQITHYTWKKH